MRGRDRLKLLAGVVMAGVLGAPAAAAAAGGPPTDGAAESHYNVGAAHSPQLLRRLAGPSGTPGQHGRSSSPAARPRGSVQGVDVAAFQHGRGTPINWPKVAAARIQFAAIKATEGNYYVNPWHSRDLARATAAGVHVIAYAFANPRQGAGNGTAAAQARFLVRHTPRLLNGRRPPLMLDIEYNPYRGGICYGLHGAAMVGWLKRFDGEIRRLTGQLPIIYTTADWWRRCTGGSRAFGTSLIWPAAWTRAARPAMPRGWRNWALWQYTSRGTVPGIPARGTIDLDALNLIAPGRQKAAVGGGVSVPVSQVVRRAVTGLNYGASRLPTGLSVHASGIVSGTPAVPGGAKSSTIKAAAQGRTLGSIGVTWDVSQASS